MTPVRIHHKKCVWMYLDVCCSQITAFSTMKMYTDDWNMVKFSCFIFILYIHYLKKIWRLWQIGFFFFWGGGHWHLVKMIQSGLDLYAISSILSLIWHNYPPLRAYEPPSTLSKNIPKWTSARDTKTGQWVLLVSENYPNEGTSGKALYTSQISQ